MPKYKLGFEGFTKPEEQEITKLVADVSALAKRAATEKGPPVLLTRWFGAQSAVALNKIVLMDKYINEKCTLLTFVRKKVGDKVNNLLVEKCDCGQVIETVGVGFPGNFNPKDLAHVQSGLRIFILPKFYKFKKTEDRFEKLNTIYHEISHKVLGTNDEDYGHEDCLALKDTNAVAAAGCADCYGYLIAELDKT